jgi:hypothetical protein
LRIGRRNAVRYPFTICAVSEGHITPICTAATTFSIMDPYLSQLHDFHCDPDNPRSRCRRNTPTGTFPHRNHDGHCEGLRDALAILRHEYETKSVHFEEPSQRTTIRTGQQNKRTPRSRPRPPSRIKQSWQQPVTAPPPQRAPLPQFHERRTASSARSLWPTVTRFVPWQAIFFKGVLPPKRLLPPPAMSSPVPP